MSNLIDSLAQDRHAARYRSATHTPLATTTTTAMATTTTSDSLNAERSSLQSTRSRAGWLLIGLGLRLLMRGAIHPPTGLG